MACTCAAYDVDVGHFWGTLLRVVGVERQFPAREVDVGPGQELTVTGQTFTLRDMPPDAMAERLAWAGNRLPEGWVAFQGQTLESVVDEFNRHNTQQLVIGDVAIRQLRIGGKFRVTDIDGFLDALAVTHSVKALRPRPGGNPQSIVLVRSASGSANPEGPIR